MSFVSPDGSKILLANQNGKMVERVDVTKNNQGKVIGFQYNESMQV